MKALKNYITNNKLLVSITSAVTLFTFIVFTVIAANSGGSGLSNNGTTTGQDNSSGSLIADNSTSENQSSGDTTTERPTPSTTPGEETTPDKEEPTTTKKPTVDPNTLPYMVMVNRAANCLTVYEKDADGKFTVPIKAITVSCGRDLEDNATPLGTYQTIENYDWRKMFDGTYSQFAYRIVGSILFHSVPYYSVNKGDLEWEEFNKLGSPASMGCIRMNVADSLWLMENCPIGTKVIIYDDAENPGPLGKPDTIKIPEDSPHKGWDPTDPDPENPWHQFHATITHPSNKLIKVEEGTSMDTILSRFKGYDKCGNDISEKLKITGNLDLDNVGNYSITVSLEDATGSKASVDITVIVTPEETTTPPETEPNPPEDETTTPGDESPSERPSQPSENPSDDPADTPSTEETTTPEDEGPAENPSGSGDDNPNPGNEPALGDA